MVDLILTSRDNLYPKKALPNLNIIDIQIVKKVD